MIARTIINKIPKPLLWLLTLPFMILLFPIGLLYSLILLGLDLKDGKGARGFKKSGFTAMLRPGFYVGLMLISLFGKIIKMTTSKTKKKKTPAF